MRGTGAYGDADGFFHALGQLNPIAVRDLVKSATPRQANCYYSSSDAAFKDRYEAYDEYTRVNDGSVDLEGGWRVYSSGAGICVRLIMHCFLGLRVETESLVIDPVVPTKLDGMRARLVLAGGEPVEVIYQTGKTGSGPVSVEFNGTPLEFTREENLYRTGGVRIATEAWKKLLTGKNDTLVISLT